MWNTVKTVLRRKILHHRECIFKKSSSSLHIAWSSGLPGLQDGINHTTEGQEAPESQIRGAAKLDTDVGFTHKGTAGVFQRGCVLSWSVVSDSL